MLIIKTFHKNNFTVIGNEAINNRALSFRDLGLLVYLLSKPEDWQITISALANVRHEGEAAVKKSLQSLKKNGYAIFNRSGGGGGEWVITDQPNINPTDKPKVENQLLGIKQTDANKPKVEKPLVENQLLGEKYTKTSNPKGENQLLGTVRNYPKVEKPLVEKPLVEKCGQLNKEYILSKDNNKKRKITFSEFLKRCKEQKVKPIPENDVVFQFADDAKLPYEFLILTWDWFKDKYSDESKKYTDWRKVFRNAIKGNWGRIWYIDQSTNEYTLTTTGQMFKRAYDNKRNNTTS